MLVTALFPVAFGHSDLGVSRLLVPFDALLWLRCLVFVLVCSCSFAFALVACSVSRCFAVAFLGLGLSCLGRVGLRFWVSGLFVRSFSFRLAACAFPASLPMAFGSWPELLWESRASLWVGVWPVCSFVVLFAEGCHLRSPWVEAFMLCISGCAACLAEGLLKNKNIKKQ